MVSRKIAIIIGMTDAQASVVLEDINSTFDLVLVAVAPVKDSQLDVRAIKEDITEIKSDIRVIKAAVTSQSHSMNDYDKRIARLEATKYHA